MTPTTPIDIPHKLGKEEAKRRLKSRIGELNSHIPGGGADVQTSWPGEDRMSVSVAAMGQKVDALLDVEESRIRLQLTLPPMLSFMKPAIEKAIQAKGGQLLLDDKSSV